MTGKQILRQCKKLQRSLAMGWIDYKKTDDMVLNGRIIEAMKMVEITDNIVNLFENNKETRRTEPTACNESIWEVDIKRVIFRGDSFSPLLFIIVLISLAIIYNETDPGYVTS